MRILFGKAGFQLAFSSTDVSTQPSQAYAQIISSLLALWEKEIQGEQYVPS